MNLEFHYYITGWLARRAGFSADDAETIAYSSQYVDNAILGYLVHAPRGDYKTIITQNYEFWNEEISGQVFMPFHFIPAASYAPSPQRKDGRANPYDVRPNSPMAKDFLIDALNSRDLYRVGIALHAYADTWAHQNFSSKLEDWNELDESAIVPPMGHAQALQDPDELSHTWEDGRLLPQFQKIPNRARFLAASEKIYKYLKTYQGEEFTDSSTVISELEGLWGPPDHENPRDFRIEFYKDYAAIPTYNRHAWLEEAGIDDSLALGDLGFIGYDKLLWVSRGIRNLLGKSKRKDFYLGDSFFNSRFFRWSEAARAHKDFARNRLREAGLLQP